ncbi:single-stranded DNA-binding protein [Streptococcus rifensis]
MLNKMIMIGRLVQNPELQTTASDKHVTRFTLAINRKYKGQDGERQTDFINAVAWGKMAENLVSYGTKGSLISVDGELRTRKYEKNGETHYASEVLCHGFQLLESRAQRAMRENNVSQDLADLVLEEEPLPF